MQDSLQREKIVKQFLQNISGIIWIMKTVDAITVKLLKKVSFGKKMKALHPKIEMHS
jgi:hypothetical protein